jgi:Tol biopolymer transport system component
MSSHDGDYEVYVASTDGLGQIVNVSREPYARDLSPSISADGSKVAWQSYGDWDYEVYIAKADGTGTAVNVSNHDEGDDYYASLQGN